MSEIPISYCEDESSLLDCTDFRIAENVNTDSAVRIVKSVNNYERLVEALRECAPGHCGCPILVEDIEACGPGYECHHCRAKALLAEIDKETS